MPVVASRSIPAAVAAPKVAAVPGHVESIEQSHLRCAALGLNRIERPDFAPLLRSDLQVARERNQRLSSQAAPIMELLSEQIRETQSMIVLTDALGTILHTVGDTELMQRAGKVALAPGVNWAEQSKGTNAIGTALFDETATLVHGGEHYMHANGFLTCSAAPIFDPRGNILGVLDVTGDQHSYHPHTMGLVRMSARMIENHWLAEDFRTRLRLHFHSRPEFIGTLMEGIVVVGSDGRILGANRAALDQLGMSGAQVRMQSVVTLFGTTVSALIDHFRSPMAAPMLVSPSSGSPLHVQARFNLRLLDRSDDDGAGASVSTHGLGIPIPHLPATAFASTASPTPGATPRGPAGPALRTLPANASGDPSGDLSGNSSGLQYLLTGCPQIRTVVDKIRRILDRDIPLLILGETGTGKELVARAVHQDSQRSRQPFVAVNCASIPETLIEAELFGYEDGAFTGARRKGAVGRILQAHGGTLFLDEIGDMPLALQARLLRVLQERQVTPLGSARSIPVDVSLIGATHRPLREMIERGEFREDLYYRLNGLTVRLPALRDRSDLLVVAQRLLRALQPENPVALSSRVANLFTSYHWPGNIRQLANVLRTASVMAADDGLITEEHLSDDFVEDLVRRSAAPEGATAIADRVVPAWTEAVHRPAAAPMATAPTADDHPVPSTAAAPTGLRDSNGATQPVETTTPGAFLLRTLPDDAVEVPAPAATSPVSAEARTLDEIELDTIRAALEAAGGNISVASRRLNISRNTIYRKLRWNRS